VALDHTNKLLVVSFRGSASIKNWIANLNFDTANTDICSGCTAHEGFWTSWREARSRVLNAIKTASQANPGYSIVLTGHSLGGAIASLAAAEIRKSGYTAALYTFGAPRFASEKLSDFITKQPGGNYRVTHLNDPVPRLPPISFNFVHVSPEYYVDQSNFKAVSASDISVYTGNVNYNGNTAWIVTDVIAHTWYFGDIALCYKKNFLDGRGLEGERSLVKKF
jgi:predicted lipase